MVALYRRSGRGFCVLVYKEQIAYTTPQQLVCSHIMSSSETDPLLMKDVEASRHTRELKCRKYMIIPVVSLTFAAYAVFLYAVIEYTQGTLKENAERNTSMVEKFKNFSVCDANRSGKEYKTYTKIQKDSSEWLVCFAVAAGMPSVISNLVLGSYSDAFGRKSIILVSLFGELLKMVLCSVIVHFKLYYAYFVIPFFLEGLTGQTVSLWSACFGYIADVTSAGKERTFGILLLEITKGASMIGSAIATGYAIKTFGFFYPMVTGSVLILFCIIITCFALPESLRKENRRKNISIKENLRSSVKFYIDKSYKGKRWKYIVYMVVFLLGSISIYITSVMEPLYQLGPPFCLTAIEVGIYGALQTMGMFLFGMLLAKCLQRCVADDVIAAFGALSGSAAMLLLGLAKSKVEMFLVPAVYCLSIVAFAMVRSLMSAMTPADSQGALFAGQGTLQTAGSVIGSAGGNAIYFATVSIFSGFVFLVVSSLFLITFIFLVFLAVVDRMYRGRLLHQKVVCVK